MTIAAVNLCCVKVQKKDCRIESIPFTKYDTQDRLFNSAVSPAGIPWVCTSRIALEWASESKVESSECDVRHQPVRECLTGECDVGYHLFCQLLLFSRRSPPREHIRQLLDPRQCRRRCVGKSSCQQHKKNRVARAPSQARPSYTSHMSRWSDLFTVVLVYTESPAPRTATSQQCGTARHTCNARTHGQRNTASVGT